MLSLEKWVFTQFLWVLKKSVRILADSLFLLGAAATKSDLRTAYH